MTIVLEDDGMCEECGKNPKTAPHQCPYQYDVNDDHDYGCTSCDECTHECAMDI